MWKNKKSNRMGWVVKNKRPEENLGSPEIYYTDEEVEKYARSSGMRRAQEKIAYRVLELLEFKPGSSLLDLGAGPGYTAEVYRCEGYDVTCLDLIAKMVEKAKENGFEAHVGDIRQIKKTFSKRKFDGVVSVSALQWIKNELELKDIAKGIYSVLYKGGRVVIQFYPKSEQELKKVLKIFIENGFSGKIITDFPGVPKNRTIYLVLRRD